MRSVKSSSDSYSADKIKVLSEISHIRANPAMYIGDIATPTHLLNELLDNAFDECMNGFAKNVHVTIDTTSGTCTVKDDGRGIPYEEDIPITISTKLFSGAKFKGSKEAYNIVSGKNGVGLVAVNALSTDFKIEIFRKKHATFIFKDCVCVEKEIRGHKNKENVYSTEVSFTPDMQFFSECSPDISRIIKRLCIASIELPQVSIILEIDKSVQTISTTKDEFFKRELLDKENVDTVKLFKFSAEDGHEKFEVMFAYEMNSAIMPRIQAVVNMLPLNGGGTQVTVMINLLKEYFLAKSKKLNLKILPNDVTVGLRSYISMNLINPELAGQSKEKFVGKVSDYSVLTKKLEKAIECYFDKNTEDLSLILTMLADYRNKQESKNHKSVTGTKRVATKLTKLRECAEPGGELFIVEGNSAAGSIIDARDSRRHAILPLRGKIPNVVSKKDILNNAEIGELIYALGTGVGSNFDITKLKYDKIIIAADNDYDGLHIASLVIMLMAILFPEIVKSGRLYIVSAPLYAIKDSKKFKPLWTSEELETARKNNFKIQYFKGLGEMNASQIKISLLDDKQRRLVKIEYSSELDKLTELFNSSECKRKLIA